ncbi:MAG: hypothetical protein C7B47_15285 [Sulfobacillus thermosulfidooxidans]|uniref:Uncharacterized protein n=1 Tax=Sulfobacillus thermosulfidooxidans TaxID=28034 RepID=A0A2T2WPW8_SULTH|nr:MAG: hypothetical protein C7B47_15285 [Sulfobacillus thermosulfidooxidans]
MNGSTKHNGADLSSKAGTSPFGVTRDVLLAIVSHWKKGKIKMGPGLIMRFQGEMVQRIRTYFPWLLVAIHHPERLFTSLNMVSYIRNAEWGQGVFCWVNRLHADVHSQ